MLYEPLMKLYPIFCLAVLFQIVFGMRLMKKFQSQIKSCRSLSLTYCQVIVGFFEEMDLFNYIVILGKSFFMDLSMQKNTTFEPLHKNFGN